MNAIEIIHEETIAAYDSLEDTVRTVTPELAAWQPPGLANSIAATYAHTMISADVDLNRIFHGREPLIEGEWGERLGLRASFPDDWQFPEDWSDVAPHWETLREYGRAVHRAVVHLAETVTQADLDREFRMLPEWLGRWKGIDVYVLHGIRHPRLHGGEIATLKGIQGVQGYGSHMRLYP